MKKHGFRSYLAEFLGTFLLVFFGCGVAATTGGDLVPTSLAFGLAIVVIAYGVGRISGGHVNPAVSLAMVLDRRMSIVDFAPYVIAQVGGAILGSLSLFWFEIGEGYAVNSTANCGSLTAFIFEIVATAIFVLVILFVTDKEGSSNLSGLVIGLTLAAIHFVGIGVDGTSVNPARSIGPAIVAAINGDFTPSTEMWIFIFAPLLGAIGAIELYWLLVERVSLDYREKVLNARDDLIEEQKRKKVEEKKAGAAPKIEDFEEEPTSRVLPDNYDDVDTVNTAELDGEDAEPDSGEVIPNEAEEAVSDAVKEAATEVADVEATVEAATEAATDAAAEAIKDAAVDAVKEEVKK